MLIFALAERAQLFRLLGELRGKKQSEKVPCLLVPLIN